ncbi:MAG TPA: FAD-dependent oxidoreductase [Longimicrobiales bacterium]|nr:FAD-dependent oxidoreductase [Longimicrobiales bacterium]
MVDRREFLKTAGAAAGALAATTSPLNAATGVATPLDEALAMRRAPGHSRQAPDVVVIGAGAFGGWTALYLQRLGARVTLVDQYGPGNSRASSGDETRGVRTAYGERETWTWWASEAIRRWIRFDEEYGDPLKMRLFYQTGDLICRTNMESFLEQTLATWQKLGIRHEVLDGDEARYRFPQMNLHDTQVALYEHDAGVVRARRACEAVAEVFRQEGGTIVQAKATMPSSVAGRLARLPLEPGDDIAGDSYVFACGPWLWKVFPELLGNRMRTSMGHVYYFGTPTGDHRYTFPNMPSWNFPGVTGWPALGPDNRGFRIRTGGRGHSDPDTVERWIDPEQFERPRDLIAQRFPGLVGMPLLETRACHYESSSSRNFIIDRVPGTPNVWIAGAGNAEGFKMGPVVGEYVANRVMERPTAAVLDEQFRIPEAEYDPL